MVKRARERLGARATVLCQDALALDVGEPVDVIVSTAALHWVPDHDRLWARLAAALRPGGMLEAQCGGVGEHRGCAHRDRAAARECAPELLGWSPWTFATPAETEVRLSSAGFKDVRCWLEPRPTEPDDPDAFVRTSILAAHFERLAADKREPFAQAVLDAGRTATGLRAPERIRAAAEARRSSPNSSRTNGGSNTRKRKPQFL